MIRSRTSRRNTWAAGHKPVTCQAVIGFCLSLEGVTLRRPYGPQPLAMAVLGKKHFCYVYEDQTPLHLLMKCDPMEAELLRAACPAIRPGYHCNKRHWNSVYLDGSLPDGEICRMIRNAYGLVTGKKDYIIGLKTTQ